MEMLFTLMTEGRGEKPNMTSKSTDHSIQTCTTERHPRMTSDLKSDALHEQKIILGSTPVTQELDTTVNMLETGHLMIGKMIPV